MLYEHYVDLAIHIDRLIADLVEHPDDQTREHVVALLEALDLLHREGLVRLGDALRATGAADALESAAEADPVVRVLLGLYGLAELELPEEEEPDASGGEADPVVGFFPVERLTVRRRTDPS